MFTMSSNIPQVQVYVNSWAELKKKRMEKAIKLLMANIARDAKRNIASSSSPEKHNLINSIGSDDNSAFVTAHFAPFIEFGTLNKVSIPSYGAEIDASIRGLAMKYKGKKLDFDELTDRIKQTIGGTTHSARRIAASIAREGTTARPFFYNAVWENLQKFREIEKQL